uniref:Ubiquitin-like domain-containing protein n=1 Tax=Strongyloides venezuelensis TaxID=75913 RepID=A0A0K0EVW4_STRVS
MESEASATIETVEFTIRSAFQSFDDHKVKCSLEWTVLDMKRHLQETCPSNPEASQQKLIFSGKCLKDSQTLREILMSHQRQLTENNPFSTPTQQDNNSVLDLESPKVIHLVIPPVRQNTECRNNEESEEDEVRNRIEENAENGRTEETSPNTEIPTTEEGFPNIPGLVTPVITNYDPSNPYHIYYQTYLTQLIQYQHYYANSLRQELGLTETAPMPSFPMMNISFQTTIQQPGTTNNGGLGNDNNINQANNDRNNNNGRNNNGLRVDYMGIALSAIRFSMLVIIMMSYVSLERFSIVVGIITVMWFLKMHRDRRQVIVNNNNDENERNLNVQQQANDGTNGQDRENPEEGETNPLLQPQNTNDYEVLEGEINDREGGEQQNNTPQQPPMVNQNMLFVFWNTFINLITSFIYSIIPENAGNLNQ